MQAQEKVDIPTADILRTSETDDEEEWTCAICLDVPAHVDRCTVVGCGHVYCGTLAISCLGLASAMLKQSSVMALTRFRCSVMYCTLGKHSAGSCQVPHMQGAVLLDFFE